MTTTPRSISLPKWTTEVGIEGRWGVLNVDQYIITSVVKVVVIARNRVRKHIVVVVVVGMVVHGTATGANAIAMTVCRSGRYGDTETLVLGAFLHGLVLTHDTRSASTIRRRRGIEQGLITILGRLLVVGLLFLDLLCANDTQLGLLWRLWWGFVLGSLIDLISTNDNTNHQDECHESDDDHTLGRIHDKHWIVRCGDSCLNSHTMRESIGVKKSRHGTGRATFPADGRSTHRPGFVHCAPVTDDTTQQDLTVPIRIQVQVGMVVRGLDSGKGQRGVIC